MNQYRFPANVDDATGAANPDALRKAWHKKVSRFIRAAKGRGGKNFFYDQYLDSPEIPDSAPVAVPWAAYPKWILTVFEGFPGALDEDAADEYAEGTDPVGLYVRTGAEFTLGKFRSRRQDEYCEWAVQRENGKIVSIQFTAEPPEYWETLYETDPDWCAHLYRTVLKNPAVKTADLAFDQDYWGSDGSGGAQLVAKKGQYNRYNKWNVGSQGLVHLTQGANTLGAEISLAADGTRAWRTRTPSPTAQELICCAQFGEPSRNSDPFIGWSVFDLVESTGASVALADPIGLYMTPFSLSDLKSPTGEPIGAKALSTPRMSADGTRILRAEVRVPVGAAYGLEDCTLGGRKLAYGGQIARRITMALFAVAKKIPGAIRLESACEGFCCAHPASNKLFDGFRFQQFQSCATVPADAYRMLPKPPLPALLAADLEVALRNEKTHFDVPVNAAGLLPLSNGERKL
jgi:hypothetical protein